MKLVQTIPIFGGPYVADSQTRVTLKAWWNYVSARYTGVTAIYFECNAFMTDPEGVGYVDLYSMHIEDPACIFNPTGTSLTKYRSADIKTAFADGKDMVVRAKMDASGDVGEMYLTNCNLIIEQEDATEAIATTSHYYLPRDVVITTSNSWQGSEHNIQKVYIADCDGTVKCYFEAYLYSTSGGTSACRLYDKTAGAVVTGSEIKTTATDPTRVTSGELTLVDGHEYYMQYRNETSGKTAYGCAAHILVNQSGFTKCIAIPAQQGWYNEDQVADWHSTSLLSWDGTKLSAGLQSYKFNYYDNIEFGVEDDGCNVRIIRTDTSATITGSTENIPWSETAVHHDGRLTPTMPTDDCTIALQEDSYYSYGMRLATILAFMAPAPPTYPYIPADPTKPSGYHAFMSCYLKNVTANYRPLATPDASERLY